MAAKLPIKSGCTVNPGDDTSALELDEETQALNWLLEAFPSISLEEIASAYSSVNCDANRTAEILTSLGGSGATPASLAVLPDEAFENDNSDLEMLPKRKAGQNQNSMKVNHTSKRSNGMKPKKFSVATGTVSSVLGNGYSRVMPYQNETQRRGSSWKSKGKELKKIEADETGTPLEPMGTKDSMQQRQVEEFLYSMMGDGCQLDMDIVRDVLRQCGYNVQKSLDRLLDMAVTSTKFEYDNGSVSTSSGGHGSEEERLIDVLFRALSESFPDTDQDELLEACKAARGHLDQVMPILLDKEKLNASKTEGEFFHQKHVTEDNCNSKSTLEQLKLSFPDLSESTLNEILESVNFSYSEARNIFLEAGLGPVSVKNVDRSTLSRQVLDSLFNVSESCEQIPSDMDWMKAVKTKKKSKRKTAIASTGNQLEPAGSLSGDGEEDEYQCFRKTASQHWGTMRSYFQEAAEAYSRGERARAAYLSEQGKFYKQLAREADEKASQRIFEFKNRDMQNDITIDLHAQHVKDALHLLKLHIKSLACISSIHCLKVITGCDLQGSKGGKIKRAISQLLEKEGINWTEENTGMLVIKMTDVNPDNLSFANTDSDG